jgi:gliding motility-associated-like protein
MKVKKTILNTFLLLLLGCFSLSMQAQKDDNDGRAVYEGCQVFVPNAFTPNGDNLNDRFTVKYNQDCAVQEYAIRIFDRWGRLVFETNAYEETQAWDGTSKGRKVEAGVYMWRLTMKMVNPNGDGQPIAVNKQGSLVLIR